MIEDIFVKLAVIVCYGIFFGTVLGYVPIWVASLMVLGIVVYAGYSIYTTVDGCLEIVGIVYKGVTQIDR